MKLTQEKRLTLNDVNPYITCVLCKGYLVDATTITECLHTFCKKCIVEYLEENTNCPVCDTLLHQSHPLLYISHDRTLQEIVYKLVPNLEKNELENQIKYCKENNLEFSASLKEKLSNDSRFASLDGNQLNKNTLNNNSNSVNNKHHDLNYHRLDEQIALSLEPLEGLNSLERKYLLCSCHSTITHLKKYVAKMIFNDLDKYKEIEILCNEEVLGKDHTLKFIYVTKWKDKEMPLRLNFRPKMNF